MDIQTIINDDFQFNNIEIDKLPNEKGIISIVLDGSIERRDYYAFLIIKDKIIMRVINFQNYEIVFDKDLNYKLKAITSENNPLNLSVNYGLYEQAK